MYIQHIVAFYRTNCTFLSMIQNSEVVGTRGKCSCLLEMEKREKKYCFLLCTTHASYLVQTWCCSLASTYMKCHTLHPTHSCFTSPLSLTGSDSRSHAFAHPWKDLAIGKNNITLGLGWLGDGARPHQSNGRGWLTASYAWTGGVGNITGASWRLGWGKFPIVWGRILRICCTSI